jgi:hypothetical protein
MLSRLRAGDYRPRLRLVTGGVRLPFPGSCVTELSGKEAAS